MSIDKDDADDISVHSDSSRYSQSDCVIPALKRLNDVVQCHIPSSLRSKLLSIRLRCIAAMTEVFLVRELNQAADGSLRENCGRQQMFMDLAGAFGELSLVLAEMKRESIVFGDEKTDKVKIEHVKRLLYEKSDDSTDATSHDDFLRRDALYKAGQWVLKLQMAMLTEDWNSMDQLIRERPHDLLACPEAIAVRFWMLKIFYICRLMFTAIH